MRRAARQKWRRRAWLIISLILLAGVIGVWLRSLAPMRELRRQAITIAETKADVTRVDDFYWDTQRDSYLTVAGRTKAKKRVYVLIRQKTGKVHVLAQSSGITQAQVTAQVNTQYAPRRITSIGLSRRGKKFVWDVGYRTNSGKLGYVTYDFETGKQLAAIRNL
ncbi:DUF5590 domain-containing protein [Lacticaseibacillus absianus]|uniref:cell wall elongation regulator TseB-like domain-containing protein n=1 Tax=Lacticaseibacillus absianus TaxID=2729623 RepID=UPI0015C7393F|nr:DUF5590 domain-containing protein [Lacticaseibacillus absianus]